MLHLDYTNMMLNVSYKTYHLLLKQYLYEFIFYIDMEIVATKSYMIP